ncbi:MAG: GNAT family N-acetyltransferase [Lentisphaeria bacterium]|nr:GNAT family N-acetyltransferase [Lentisphaeria bacterium]
MIKYCLLTEFPGNTLERIAGFYISAGWISAGDDISFLLPALQGSFRVAGAFKDGQIIGIARVLSDGCSDAYIQDVAVAPEYRGQGIGSGLISTLTDELHRCKIDWIALVGEPGTEGFYRKLHWREQPGYVLWKSPEE